MILVKNDEEIQDLMKAFGRKDFAKLHKERITDKNGNTSKIKRITNGTYYYDVQKGNIKIPVYNQSNSHWSTFEKSNSTLISFLPNTLSMGYWSGNGTPIVL